MAEQTEDIVGLVESVVRPLVDFPDDLDISASDAEDGSILVEMRVNEEDAGKVIGRQGRVIKAIRTLTLDRVFSRTGAHVEGSFSTRCARGRRAELAKPKNLIGGLVARSAPGLPFLLHTRSRVGAPRLLSSRRSSTRRAERGSFQCRSRRRVPFS